MSGFNFGATSTPAATTPATGFAFGAAPKSIAPTMAVPNFGTSIAQGNLGATSTFSAPAATPSTFGFGAAASSTPATTATLGFGLTAPPAAAATSATMPLNFSATTATPGSALPAATAAPSFGLGGTNFSFGKTNIATTSTSLNFGTTTTSLGTGLFGKPAATTVTGTTASAAPFVGLGGVDITSTQPKAGDFKQDSIKIKETQVPDEIAKTVDTLKAYIKAQKTIASDIGRTSTSKLNNVSAEIMKLQWSVQEIAHAVESNYNHIKLLRKETSTVIQSVEMAQRTQDTPAGLQFENNTPFQYFQNLTAKYEQDLLNFREQITLIERHMHSLTNPENVSPEDIKRGLRQINESFISLAGRLHELHQNVELQKEQYLNLRKYRLRDNSNVFAQLDNAEKSEDCTRISAGPSPFSNINAMSSFGKSINNAAASAAATSVGIQIGK